MIFLLVRILKNDILISLLFPTSNNQIVSHAEVKSSKYAHKPTRLTVEDLLYAPIFTSFYTWQTICSRV